MHQLDPRLLRSGRRKIHPQMWEISVKGLYECYTHGEEYGSYVVRHTDRRCSITASMFSAAGCCRCCRGTQLKFFKIGFYPYFDAFS